MKQPISNSPPDLSFDPDAEILPTPADQLNLPTITARVPPEMKALAFLVGTWDVEAFFRFRDTWVQVATQAEYRPILDGTMIEERLAVDLGGTSMRILAQWCWDRYRETYRVVRSDNLSSRSNVFEGSTFEDVLILTNLRSDTAHIVPERRKHQRFSLFPEPPNRHRIFVEESLDGGEHWTVSTRYHAVRSS